MRRRNVGLALCVAALAVVAHTVEMPQLFQCLACGTDTALLRDFVVGTGLIGALMWAMTWLETAPLRHVALHLGGISAAAYLVFSLAPRL